MIEVTRSKNDLFPILADLCSYGVRGPQKSIWGHRGQNLRSQGQKMTFSQLWLIRAPMGSRGLKSESVIPKSAKVLQSWKFVILTISGLGCNMYFLKELWRYCFHRRSIIVCLQKYGQFNLVPNVPNDSCLNSPEKFIYSKQVGQPTAYSCPKMVAFRTNDEWFTFITEAQLGWATII